MKKLLSAIILAMMVLVSAFASPNNNSGMMGEYVGEYNEEMTPENSCVIFFIVGFAIDASFTQINPKCDADLQKFSFGVGNTFAVFKPCKPGSRYQLKTMNCSDPVGNVINYYLLEFKPNERCLVYNVPDKPGVYCYPFIDSADVAKAAMNKEDYGIIEASDLDEKYGCKLWKYAEKNFKKLYAGTPWWDEFLKRKAEAEEKYKIAKAEKKAAEKAEKAKAKEEAKAAKENAQPNQSAQ